MSESYDYQKAWQRERLARQQAERLLEDKTRHLYDKVLELEASQARLAAAQDQLLQSEKLQAIGQLTAGLAHEINNPLCFCLPNLQMLQQHQADIARLLQQHPACAEQKLSWLLSDSGDIIEELQHGLQRIQNIIKQLYHYSTLGQSTPAELSLLTLWSNVWSAFNAEQLTVVSIDSDICDTTLEVHPVEMTTALVNIIDNALKAQASQLTIRCNCPDNQLICMKIYDNGIGMSEQTIRKVFEPFFTTRNVGEGRGLGLTVSYSIIRQHHGNIEFNSEPSGGTCCTVTIPRTHHNDDLIG
jgi:signal transduction histidine kinase